MNNKTHHIREKFQYKKHIIDRLAAEDPEFLSLCEDYDACVNAVRYWTESKAPEAETRANEYRDLVRDLQEEIAKAIEALESRRRD